MSNVKSLGVLGLGNRSTLFYIQQLNQAFQNRHGGFSTFPFVLLNTNFNDINPYLPDQFHKLNPAIKHYLAIISNYPIEALLIPNITLHESVDQVWADYSTINLLHPVHLTGKRLADQGIDSVVIFGSAYTMQSNYIKNILSEYNIQVLSPELSDRKTLDELRQKIYHNTDNQEDYHTWEDLVNRHSTSNPIVVGCTELSIWSGKHQGSSIFDMATIQIETALNIYNERKA